MKNFLEKYKYISLVTGALAIAVVSGTGGAFVYKKTREIQSRKAMQELISKVQTVNIRGDKGSTGNSSIKDSDANAPVKAHSITVSPSKDNAGATEISVEFEGKHDHEDGSCCEARSKGLPCTGGDEKETKRKNIPPISSQPALTSGDSHAGVGFGGLSFISGKELIEKLKQIEGQERK